MTLATRCKTNGYVSDSARGRNSRVPMATANRVRRQPFERIVLKTEEPAADLVEIGRRAAIARDTARATRQTIARRRT